MSPTHRLMVTSRRTRLSPHDERVVAVQAKCDPRTVRKYLQGAPVAFMVAARIDEALAALEDKLPPAA